MTSLAAAAPRAHAHHDDRSFVQKYIFSTDHKIIGIQFLFLSLLFLFLGGVLAMQIRWQLGFPGQPSWVRTSMAKPPPNSSMIKPVNMNWMPMIL